MKQRYFNLAKRLAKKSNHSQHQIGCVIVKKKRIISVGWNEIKTSPKSPNPYYSRHSEFNAVLGVPVADLRGSEVYVYRETRDGKLAMSRPCSDCLKMLKSLDIDIIHYSSYNSYRSEKI